MFLQPEPIFITLALYDAKEGKKLSEDFHFDPNTEEIRDMIPKEVRQATDMLNSVDGATSKQPDLYGLDESWLAYPKLVRQPFLYFSVFMLFYLRFLIIFNRNKIKTLIS